MVHNAQDFATLFSELDLAIVSKLENDTPNLNDIKDILKEYFYRIRIINANVPIIIDVYNKTDITIDIFLKKNGIIVAEEIKRIIFETI